MLIQDESDQGRILTYPEDGNRSNRKTNTLIDNERINLNDRATLDSLFIGGRSIFKYYCLR